MKNNRNSTECKSFTMGAPEHNGNATDNTFAVALGLKNAPGWSKVERLFREDLEALCGTDKPIMLHHGVMQKMVPCFFHRAVVLSDKFGKPFLTGTMSFGSDVHRCYGVSGKVETPYCDTKKIETHFQEERNGKAKREFGWCESFIDKKGGRNGAFLPSCLSCCKVGLMKLGFKFSKARKDLPNVSCNMCHDLDMLLKKNALASTVLLPLDWPAHDHYPTSVTEGSPAAAPKGRDVFKEGGVRLPFIDMDWNMLIQACKFAFYQSCVRKWTKAVTVHYLSTCGVATDLAGTMYDIASACKKAKKQESVRYNEEAGICGLQFPGSWLSFQISIMDYIEAVMHILFLGVAKSNWELVTKWLTDTPKMSNAGFLNALQELIKDLRLLSLSWLPAYPLTGQKGKLGTGSWVAENWITLVRISQFVYGYIVGNSTDASEHGADDVSRMVISFHAFVARCMTHSGVNGSFIQETKRYLKEFLSAVRELDVRLHYK